MNTSPSDVKSKDCVRSQESAEYTELPAITPSQYPDPILEERFFDRAKCTEEEYWTIPIENGKYDLVDGTLEARTMADARHTSIQRKLAQKFGSTQRMLKNLHLACDITSANMKVGNSYRKPDCIIGKPLHNGLISFEPGNISLVAEVTSNSTRSVDCDKKLKEYQRAKIPEYWVIVRHEQRVVIHKLRGDKYIPRIYSRKSSLPAKIFRCSNCARAFKRK